MKSPSVARVFLTTSIYLILFAAPGAHAATTCGMIDLRVGVKSDGSEAHDNNDLGVIVGWHFDGGSILQKSFVWQAGVVTYLPGFGSDVGVTEINNQGLMVGDASIDDTRHAVLWRNLVARDLGTLGGDTSIAFDINDSGQVVGGSSVASGEEHAFLWQNGVMTDLATILGPGRSYAYAINGKGRIVGEHHGEIGGSTAFLIQNGTVMYLTGLNSQLITPRDINDNGQIVGHVITPKGNSRAFLWQNGVMRGLGTLGGTESRATAINANGQITGWARVAGTNQPHAFLWQNGVMKDIGTLDGRPSQGNGINIKGQVVGGAKVATVDGGQKTHAFRWKRSC